MKGFGKGHVLQFVEFSPARRFLRFLQPSKWLSLPRALVEIELDLLGEVHARPASENYRFNSSTATLKPRRWAAVRNFDNRRGPAE